MSLIIPGGSGDPRRQAARNPFRGEARNPFRGEDGPVFTAAQMDAMNRRLDGMLPSIVSGDPSAQRTGLLEDDFRRIGATPSPFRRFGQVVPGATNPGAGNLISAQTPYQPEFASPDRQQYPVHRILANRYWRLFHKLDPVIGNCIDLFSEMPWSGFQLTGEGVDGEVKDHFERMCEKIELLALLPYIVREFMVVGEAIPHLMYDDDARMWDYCTLHNPDNIEVIDAPFIRMEPIVELIPDQRLRALLSSGDPLVQRVKAQLPPELLGRLLSRQNLPLDSLNCTFIPRKLHPYDVRGTSIISRLWRVLMLEDAVFCMIPGTCITMADGTTTNVEDIKKGTRVLDRHGKVAIVENQWAEPASTIKRVTLYGKHEIRCTPGHRFPVWAYPRVCQCGCGASVKWPSSYIKTHGTKGQPVERKTYGLVRMRLRSSKRCVPVAYEPMQELRADELRAGDYFMVPRTFDALDIAVTAENRARARLLGYYVSEGSPRNLNDKGVGIQWAFGIHEIETWAEDVKQLCGQLGHTAAVYRTGNNGCTVTLQRYEDRSLVDFLIENGGTGAKTKRLSADFMRWPVALKEEFVRGLFRGDGSRWSRPARSGRTASFNVSFASTSEDLVDQVFLVLVQLGMYATRRVHQSTGLLPGGKERKTPSTLHIMLLKGQFADQALALVWGERFDRGERSNAWSKAWIDDDYVYVPIKRIEDEPYDGPVYNLTVSGDHSYLADGIGTFNSATIATARRHAGPLRIAKIGNPQTGWIPGPEHEKRLLELLAQAELDPLAWIVYHFGVQFEAFGTTDRVISVGREWETLERIKLVGLGVSKSFLHGEVTYASSITGLQVFLQRLLALRGYFESKWISPKFFRPIAEINEFVKPTKAELSHRVRVRRTAQELEDDSRYIVPKIDWDKKLDPYVDRELIGAYESLERIGVKISKKTKLAAVGLKHEDEMKSSLQEEVLEAKERQKFEEELGPAGQGPTGMQPSDQQQPGQQAPGRGQPGGPPALQPPPRPGTTPQTPALPPAQPTQQVQQAAPDAIIRRPMPAQPPPEEAVEAPERPRDGNWTKGEIDAVVQLFRTGQSDEAFWAEAATPRFIGAVERDDYEEAWDDLQLYLEQQGYPDEDVGSLRKILVLEGVLEAASEDVARNIYDALPEHGIDSDEDAGDAFARAFSGRKARSNGRSNGSLLGGRASLSVLVGAGNLAAPGGGGGSTNPFRRGPRGGRG